MNDWTIDERNHAGREHIEEEAVQSYDERAPFDPSREVELLQSYGIGAEDIVVDVGSGTGVFAVAMASHCKQVVGIDVSETMISKARNRAESVANVRFINTGIIAYEHDSPEVAAVFSRNTLHHLPAFWKGEAVKQIAMMLEPGGIFRYRDITYSFNPWESTGQIDGWIDSLVSAGMDRDTAISHVQEEYSQYAISIEALLEVVGFEIIDYTYHDDIYAYYTCRWPGR